MAESSKTSPLEIWTRILSLGGAVVVFWWGVYQFESTQKEQSASRRIEATKPFLERQLQLYSDASHAAATIATSVDRDELAKAHAKFWFMYWGELALVENLKVDQAMRKFGDELNHIAKLKTLNQPVSNDQLQQLSLELAHACRESLADSWGVEQWRSPY